jgi:LacI family transcriptional regulator
MLSKLGRQVEATLIDRLKDLPPQHPLPPEPVLAKEVGVSRHTIRAALASLEAQEIVRRIKRKGTFPARGNKSLPIFQRRARMIGIISSHPFGKTNYSREIAGAAYEEASLHGYNLVFAKIGLKENIYQILDDPHVDGLILFPGLRDQTVIRELSERHKPICIVDHHSESTNVESIEPDSRKGAQLAVRHLHQLGHRKIAFINADDPELNPFKLRGYETTMKQLKVYIQPEWIVARAHSQEGGAQAALELLSLPLPKRPTAIIALSTKMGYGAMRAILKRRLKIPKDISILALGGSKPLFAKDLPDMTTTFYDYPKLGKVAVQRLLERIKRPSSSHQVTLLPVVLEIHETTGKI